LEHSAEVLTVDADGRLVTSVGDIADPDTWRRANPAYPSRISHDFLLDQLETLGPELFAREHLCVWDPEAGADGSAFDSDHWASLADPSAERGSSPSFGVAVAPDRSWSAIAVAWKRPDGLKHVMVSDYQPGASWLEERAQDLLARWGGRLEVAAKGLVTGHDKPVQAALAHNTLADLVEARGLRHGNQGELNTAVRSARWKPSGDTRVLDRKGSADISPLDAAAVALHGLINRPSGGLIVLE
jgi:hypothetical protein